MRNTKKDTQKIRLHNLIFGISTVTIGCLYYGLRLGNLSFIRESQFIRGYGNIYRADICKTISIISK